MTHVGLLILVNALLSGPELASAQLRAGGTHPGRVPLDRSSATSTGCGVRGLVQALYVLGLPLAPPSDRRGVRHRLSRPGSATASAAASGGLEAATTEDPWPSSRPRRDARTDRCRSLVPAALGLRRVDVVDAESACVGALDGLDATWFTSSDVIWSDYPLLLPAIEAAGFRFTGYRTELLDVQSLFFFVGVRRRVHRRGRPTGTGLGRLGGIGLTRLRAVDHAQLPNAIADEQRPRQGSLLPESRIDLAAESRRGFAGPHAVLLSRRCGDQGRGTGIRDWRRAPAVVAERSRDVQPSPMVLVSRQYTDRPTIRGYQAGLARRGSASVVWPDHRRLARSRTRRRAAPS